MSSSRQEHDKKANWSADAQGSAASQMTSDSSAELLRGSGNFPQGPFGTQQQGGFQQASSSGIGPNPGGISGNFPQGIFGTQPQGGFQKASQQRASSNRAGSTNVEGGLSGGLWTEPQQLENFQEDYTSAGANLGGISSTGGAGRENFQQGGFQQASSSGIGPNPGGISGQGGEQQGPSPNRAGSTNVEGGLSGGLWTEPQQQENFQEDYTSAGANLGGISSTDGAGRETFQQGLTSERGSNLGGFQGSDLAGKENVSSTSDKHRLGGIAHRDADQPLLSSGGNTRTNARTSGRRH